MSSLIEGYSNDIFISYRQKDNKGDRWVSEFVEALKTELESTFKEEVSVYFDINPHDGLLETHDVDASLKDKLKCLVFIPILSRTYCDPKSFAWQHELLAFIEQASRDRFGLKVNLFHGNVATRILPVKIHELDATDMKLCETVLGGVPRGVDFIFKSTGVNRPLRIAEDNPKDNLNHTYYRDQINKVANALKEIIDGIKNSPEEIEPDGKEVPASPGIVDQTKFFTRRKKLKIFVASAVVALMAICFAGYLVIKRNNHDGHKQSLAFIPFKTPAGDYALMNTGDNFVESVRSKMVKINGIDVMPRISTLQLKGSELSMRELRRQLKADYYIGGRVWVQDGKTKIFVELSESASGNQLWSDDYEWDQDNSGELTNDVVSVITQYLNLKLTPDDRKSIFTELTDNTEARLNYLSANAQTIDSRYYLSYDYDIDTAGFQKAVSSYDRAIELDPWFAEAYIGRSIAASWGVFLKQLDTSFISKSRKDINIAAELDKGLAELPLARGFYYYFCVEKLDSALKYFTVASLENPYDYQPLYYIAMVYRRNGKWKSAINLLSKVAKSNPREALFLTNIGMTYHYLHQYDSALYYHQKAIDLIPRWKAAYINKIESMVNKTGKTKEAWQLINSALKNTGDSLIKVRVGLYMIDHEFVKAIETAVKTRPGVAYTAEERYLDIAKSYSFLKNNELSRLNYDSAQVRIQKLISSDPENALLHAELGMALAGTGNFRGAEDESDLAVKLSVRNGLDYVDMRVNLARVYTVLGDYGRAMDVIEPLLSGPSQLSAQLLMTDPAWTALQDIQEFKKMINMYPSK